MEILRKRAFNTAGNELAKSLADHIYIDSQVGWDSYPMIFNGHVPVDSGEKVIYLYTRLSPPEEADYRIEFVHLDDYSNEREREADVFFLRPAMYFNTTKWNWKFSSYRRFHLKRVFGGFGSRGFGMPGVVESFDREYRDPSFVREWTKLVPEWKDKTKIYQQLAS